ncbi:hypothetical protein B0T22DRAFT_239351 [Podospora appendiculata]|uniref:Uncharacterized protein n=1 Tax=Podospora appendiculata TaxID=314037 RepID=A0AAE1CAZ8_9PEZI|nr:hypothetical protein B0T22DRAFT_239351 [Podospora appendiculata]
MNIVNPGKKVKSYLHYLHRWVRLQSARKERRVGYLALAHPPGRVVSFGFFLLVNASIILFFWRWVNGGATVGIHRWMCGDLFSFFSFSFYAIYQQQVTTNLTFIYGQLHAESFITFGSLPFSCLLFLIVITR